MGILNQFRKTILISLVIALISLTIGVSIGLDQNQRTTMTSTQVQVSTQTEIRFQVSTLTMESPAQLETLTQEFVIQSIEYLTEYISGNCTQVEPTLVISTTNTTEYIFPTNTGHFLNVTFTTITTTLQSEEPDRIVTICTASLQQLTFTFSNSTTTSYSTATCPVIP